MPVEVTGRLRTGSGHRTHACRLRVQDMCVPVENTFACRLRAQDTCVPVEGTGRLRAG